MFSDTYVEICAIAQSSATVNVKGHEIKTKEKNERKKERGEVKIKIAGKAGSSLSDVANRKASIT